MLLETDVGGLTAVQKKADLKVGLYDRLAGGAGLTRPAPQTLSLLRAAAPRNGVKPFRKYRPQARHQAQPDVVPQLVHL